MTIETLENIAIIFSIACAIGVLIDAFTSGELFKQDDQDDVDGIKPRKKPIATYKKRS